MPGQAPPKAAVSHALSPWGRGRAILPPSVGFELGHFIRHGAQHSPLILQHAVSSQCLPFHHAARGDEIDEAIGKSRTQIASATLRADARRTLAVLERLS